VLSVKHTAKITLLLVGVFLLAQVIGLLVIQSYIDVQQTQQTGQVTFEELPLGIQRPQIEEDYSFVYIMVAVLIGTLMLLVLIYFKFYRIWKIWYGFAIFVALTIAFGAFVDTRFGAFIDARIAMGLALVVMLWKVLRPNVFIHNFGELFIYGGLASIFVPIMNEFAAVMLLLLISLYDMYAVWKSKHMVALAQFQTESNMFAGFYVPYSLPNARIEKKAKSVRKVETTQVKSAILGGGDIAFPLLFSGAVFKVYGLHLTLIISLTAALALLGLLTFGKKDRFYPAMPFLSVGCLVGYGIILLVHYL